MQLSDVAAKCKMLPLIVMRLSDFYASQEMLETQFLNYILLYN